ncbi:hypothetical protein BCR41DRAFT_383224 [Lobosporangium transversale]|uniref:C2 domain-containing protein n=1 Tax=Lobosporangium transversale TaxID=64571 RepID=A0A1Y2H1G8_9FUNG|nr:hypothetical protein BCR41DRAFT_383224 [Lobosporangium transversale]ORZ28397.1 hypothetical protein BCR41DRAFT_383224 [Lobosporangium transversale]|eukprot:XP_021886082.1 hypothetical protein BCR41DRAFT_383224 [Lobosporangium transversale]
MFSWKKQNPPSKQRQTQQGTNDYSDLIAQGMRLAQDVDGDDDMGDIGDIGDDDLGDADLNDPELLAELQGLTGETSISKPIPAPTPRQSSAKTSTPAATLTQASTKPVSASNPLSTKVSATTDKSAASPTPPPLAGLGVDLQGIMEDDDDDVELTEDDWKDPHLLAQLQTFGGHIDHSGQDQAGATEAKPIIKQDENTSSQAQAGMDSATISTTTALNPPTNLSSLSSKIGNNSIENHKPKSASSSMIAIAPKDQAFIDGSLDGDTDMSEQSQPPQVGVMIAEGPQKASPTLSKTSKRLEPIPQKNDKELLQLLKARDVQYKRAALEAKRAGDMTLAAERVMTFKKIQKWIAVLEAGGFLDLELYPIPDEPPTILATAPTTTSAKTSKGTGAAPIAASSSTSTRIQSGAEGRAFSPPIASSASEATTHVTSSIAEASADDVRGGSTARGTLGGIKFKQLAADDDFQIVSNSDDDTYDMLQSQLESQIKMCTTTCAYYYQTGDKQTALEFHKLNKIFKTDLASLQSYRQHGRKAPAFHFQDVRFEVEVGFYQEIGLNELSLSIVRAWDLSHKDVQPTEIESYVSWDLGWPTENMAGSGAGKGTTPTVKRTNKPDYNYSKILGIERTRAFHRFVERRKATFEVWHYRGILWKGYLLGRAQVSLQPLMNHSEIHEIVPLLDPTTRRATGGKIEIKIQLQRPLLKPEIVTKEEKWLVIDEFNSGGLGFPSPITATSQSRPATNTSAGGGRAGAAVGRSNKAAVASTTPVSRATSGASPTSAPEAPKQTAAAVTGASAARSSKPAAPPSKTTTPVAQALEPVKTTPVGPSAPAATGDDLEDTEAEKALNEFNSVDLIVSNMVLESEVQIAQQMVHDAKAAGKNEAAEEYQDRLTQLEIKLKLLVLQVQMGQLTMEAYCQKVNERIVKDKKLAVELKRLGMVPEAMRALARSKIMVQEMKEVEEAMAAQGEGDEEEENV